MGEAYEAMGNEAAARDIWTEITHDPVQEGSEAVIYQALALRMLGRSDDANKMLNDLVTTNKASLDGSDGPSAVTNFVLGRAMGLLGKQAEAESYMDAALEIDPDAALLARIEASQPADAGSE